MIDAAVVVLLHLMLAWLEAMLLKEQQQTRTAVRIRTDDDSDLAPFRAGCDRRARLGVQATGRRIAA